jgi:hypothetical protein
MYLPYLHKKFNNTIFLPVASVQKYNITPLIIAAVTELQTESYMDAWKVIHAVCCKKIIIAGLCYVPT